MENITESKTTAPTSSSRAKSTATVDNNNIVQTLPSPSYERTKPENITESKNTPAPLSPARSKVVTDNNNVVKPPPIFSISSYKSELGVCVLDS